MWETECGPPAALHWWWSVPSKLQWCNLTAFQVPCISPYCDILRNHQCVLISNEVKVHFKCHPQRHRRVWVILLWDEQTEFIMQWHYLTVLKENTCSYYQTKHSSPCSQLTAKAVVWKTGKFKTKYLITKYFLTRIKNKASTIVSLQVAYLLAKQKRLYY